jgi:hypothetical protein
LSGKDVQSSHALPGTSTNDPEFIASDDESSTNLNVKDYREILLAPSGVSFMPSTAQSEFSDLDLDNLAEELIPTLAPSKSDSPTQSHVGSPLPASPRDVMSESPAQSRVGSPLPAYLRDVMSSNDSWPSWLKKAILHLKKASTHPIWAQLIAKFVLFEVSTESLSQVRVSPQLHISILTARD